MPKLLDITDMQSGPIPGLGSYNFSGVRPERLGASEYTLVTIAVDTSTSVFDFRTQLIDCLRLAVDSCRKSPRAANILVRVITFARSVKEVHGFRPLNEIDTAAEYGDITIGGSTALYDATASAVGATT
jgi:hypothetical protein